MCAPFVSAIRAPPKAVAGKACSTTRGQAAEALGGSQKSSHAPLNEPPRAARAAGRVAGMIRGMKIAVAFDHRGVALREAILDSLEGHEVVDLGTHDSAVKVDYPDKAQQIGDAILGGQAERGVLVCGSGAGAAIAACKIAGIRAAICHDLYSAHQAVEHDDMNVICLGSEIVGPSVARELVSVFLAARFDGGERYVARLDKVAKMERGMRDG
jgi:ribose 5-phosphate isomerase B